ncbi:hypothetical protein BYT27DRAFT_7250062 [Phlegmacium glaucopus]|nr:hypothetical protein BYT27DRAFT_7250062 [Phlegmacium glaucopus]
MLDEDQSSEDDNNSLSLPATKKKKSMHSIVLSEDEEELAASLRPISTSTGAGYQRESEYLDFEGGHPLQSLDALSEVDSEDLVVEESSNLDLLEFNTSAYESSTNAPTSHSRSSGKVTEEDFSSNIRILARAAKCQMRMKVALGEGLFPDAQPDKRAQLIWNIIVGAAESSVDSQLLRIALNQVSKDINLKKNMITFTMYGQSGLLNSLITKAHTLVPAHYGLKSDSKVVISERVTWLLQKGRFKFSGIDNKNKTFNNNAPLGNDIIADLISAQLFHTGYAKSDVKAAAKIILAKSLPISLIPFVITMVEHTLKEWGTGKHIKLSFTEELGCSGYHVHLSSWNALKAKSPKWAEAFPQRLFKTIAQNSSSALFLEDDLQDKEDLEGIDFEELEHLADVQD